MSRALFSSAILTLLLVVHSSNAANPRPAGVPSTANLHQASGAWVLRSNTSERVWYADGNLKAEGALRSGERHGSWIFYHENGKKKASGDFMNGKMEGAWQHFDKTGKLAASGNYSAGHKEGEWLLFYPSGSKRGQGPYRLGKRQGLWINYYESGQVFYKGNYQQDQAHGVWEYFFKNGNLHQRGNFNADVRSGTWYICIFADGPCQNQLFQAPRAPRISSMPPADQARKNYARDTSNPAGILDSMDSGPVPDKVPSSLKKNSWD